MTVLAPSTTHQQPLQNCQNCNDNDPVLPLFSVLSTTLRSLPQSLNMAWIATTLPGQRRPLLGLCLMARIASSGPHCPVSAPTHPCMLLMLYPSPTPSFLHLTAPTCPLTKALRCQCPPQQIECRKRHRLVACQRFWWQSLWQVCQAGNCRQCSAWAQHGSPQIRSQHCDVRKAHLHRECHRGIASLTKHSVLGPTHPLWVPLSRKSAHSTGVRHCKMMAGCCSSMMAPPYKPYFASRNLTWSTRRRSTIPRRCWHRPLLRARILGCQRPQVVRASCQANRWCATWGWWQLDN